MPFIIQGKTNWKFLLIVFILAVIVGGGILVGQYGWLGKGFALTPTPIPQVKLTPQSKEIGPTAVWDCLGIECLEKWHGCESLDCISGIMKQYGASSDAINFTKLLSERGYLEQFQEMGKIDLGVVAFLDRVNTNEAYYLLNGFPSFISTEISEESINEIKQDSLYSEMKEKYPNIWFWGFAPQFVEKKVLPNNNERFVFAYGFVNGCRTCDTEYSARIGFDFDSDGKFLKIIFLQIIKGEPERS